MQSEQTEERPMSDRPGLSIFDDPDENGGSGRSRDDEKRAAHLDEINRFRGV